MFESCYALDFFVSNKSCSEIEWTACPLKPKLIVVSIATTHSSNEAHNLF